MNRRRQGAALAGMAALVLGGAWQAAAPAQPQGGVGAWFEFQIVESFDAKYLGDSPGHRGRGSLGGAVPSVALGDPVFHGSSRIGHITGLLWDRSKESLEVEFDPEPFELDAQGRPVRANRITVGETVRIPLGGPVRADNR